MKHVFRVQWQCLLILPLLLLAVFGASAQDLKITGKVTSKTGDGLPGVTVLLKGTTTGTATGADGGYALTVPRGGGALIFSFIGFATKEAAIPPGGGTLNVTLEDDTKALEEVVVIGYGTTKKETLSGSVTTVKGADIIKAPVVNVSNSMTGRLPGV